MAKDYSGAFGSSGPTFNPGAFSGPSFTPDSSGSSDKWKQAFGMAGQFLAKSLGGDRDRDKYREQGSAQFGGGSSASTSEGPDKWTKIYTPALQQPVYMPGVQGDPGLGGSLIGAAATIGSAFISDIRFKENIEKIGVSSSGTNVYRWNYIGKPQRYQGVIAQEVPWACIDKDGIKYVDYSKVDVDFQKVNA